MKDQAEDLRLRIRAKEQNKTPRTLAVVSGKGGVGKSNISLNFSISLAKKGLSVLLFDMDLGMGNLDILMGKSSEVSIIDYFDGNISLREAIMNGPEGLHYIAGGSGLSHLVHLDEKMVGKFTQELEILFSDYDYVIFDMGAGITNESIKFILSVQEIVCITTPEPTAIMDAYSMLKHIHIVDSSIPYYIVINRVQSEREGQQTFDRISKVLKSFLDRDSYYLGMLPDDRVLQQAVRRQTPFILYNEKSASSKAIMEITERFNNKHFYEKPLLNGMPFISKLKRLLFER
ncbi:MinD/ParA family protein [Bacillus sp. S/N-304-OC-R1]|uniref:MinD/ParA family protein n=1 Tax=Bacillus sp. S/N-304-OC-R1 TaxID=2758034 RepID=UPI001C8EFC45|nr:MinD/ParA family protein [Bacillus sp. S/N-304-OC-R1]MBY0120676.1 MinD/ParA family protein [Bacillus sp. S/N-304-OC-R1]